MVPRSALPEILNLLGTGLADLGRVPEADTTIVLLGPDRDFWDIFTQSPEWIDGRADPIDAWSTRVITDLANAVEGAPLFPFGGPPYQPFLQWAVDSGEAWQSPTGPLVHARLGMMVSYRGAIRVPGVFERRHADKPCDSCSERPCENACPVGALSTTQAYDVPACHDFLRSADGQNSCYAQGCRVRRVCPASAGAHRNPSQSAYHMTRFLP